MKYDIIKCNNLRYELKRDGEVLKGFIKVWEEKANEIRVALVNSEDSRTQMNGGILPFMDAMCRVEEFYNVVKEEDFCIIPRNSDLYNDWQVGDNIKRVDDETQGGQIMAVQGRIYAVKWIGDNEVKWYLKSYLNDHCEMRLTDYEKYIKEHPQKGICSFVRGDKVLVRDGDLDEWVFGIFEGYKDGDYCTSFGAFTQCVPLNSETWKYLGTNENITKEVTDLC